MIIPPKKFLNYMKLMRNILDYERYSFQEVAIHQIWWDAMVEEYNSTLKNDIWDIVTRTNGKSIMSFRSLYKIKHTANGRIEKFIVTFIVRVFSNREGVDYDDTLYLVNN